MRAAFARRPARWACRRGGARTEDSAKNPLHIVILDACRNNPFARSFRASQVGLAQMDAPSGTFTAFATAPVSIASDGDGENGLYTRHLLAELAPLFGSDAADCLGGRTLTAWYAPQAKRVVKFSSRQEAGRVPPVEADFELELVSYRLN
jgi:hypothetical protein